jgi:CRISPR-associated endonuclease/helicase Cas3
MAGIASLVEQVFRWFPKALAPEAAPLPAAAEFQHAFSGLVTLADWLGSDRDIFPFRREEDPLDRMSWSRGQARLALTRMGVDTRAARQLLGPRAPTFEEFFVLQPRATQALVTQLPVDSHGGITVLEAETGSGKTEAALARFLTLFHAGAVDGLYFALPTRTAATQIHARVVRALERLFRSEEERPPVVLAVPEYLAVDNKRGRALPGFEVLWNDDDRERWRFRGWAAEHPKRFLAGAVVIGTIDTSADVSARGEPLAPARHGPAAAPTGGG